MRRARRLWSCHAPGVPRTWPRRSPWQPFDSGGEPVDDTQGFLEGTTPVHAGSVVEHDRDDVLGVRTKIVNEQSSKPGFRLPRKQVQPVSRLVGPQSAPLATRIIGVDAGGSVAELRRSARSGTNCRRRQCRSRRAGGRRV